MEKIKTFIINLDHRVDRRRHIVNEFKNRSEFSLNLISAIKDNVPAIGLWKTILQIVSSAKAAEDEFILICEDDHQFTSCYNVDGFGGLLSEGATKGFDVLLGGISSFDFAVPITDRLFWVNIFNGLQFTIIYKKFYDVILNSTFDLNDISDFKISRLSEGKAVIFPFISTQKDFGYSDVTFSNNQEGRIDRLFYQSEAKLSQLFQIHEFYN